MKNQDEEPQEIACCPECGNPVIWTFMFSGCEYFCWLCKWAGGMLSADEREETPYLKALLDRFTRKFNRLRDQYIPHGAYKISDCQKCRTRESTHIEHATQQEIEASKAAYQAIMKPIPISRGGTGKEVRHVHS